jgi:hypothetical protein
MFNKIYDWFDNTFDYGFHKENTKTKRVDPDSALFVLEQAAEVWDLWIKNPVTFRLSGSYNQSGFGSAPFYFRSAIEQARHIYLSSDEEKEEILKNPDMKLCHGLIEARKTEILTTPGSPETIVIPYATMASAPDFASAVDAVTAIGLDALEFNNNTLLELNYRCIQALVDNANSNDAARGDRCFGYHEAQNMAMVSLNIHKEPQYHLHCDMFLKTWAALCTTRHRQAILDKWPGWAELFESYESTILDSKTSVQKFLDGKAFGNSEYERFFTALAYNTNTSGHRVKLPKLPQFDMAASVVKRYWPELLAADPSTQIVELGKMMTEIRGILSLDPNANGKAPRKVKLVVGVNPVEESQANSSKDHMIECRPSDGQESVEDEDTNQTMVPAVFGLAQDYISAPRTAKPEFVSPQQLRLYAPNNRLTEEVASAVWRVAHPPANDHGQLDGVLDEGALHKLAGWGDAHVFDRPPEAGAGSVVLGIMMDVSGSMVNLLPNALGFLHAIIEGSKNHKNVKLIPVCFSAVSNHVDRDKNQTTICSIAEFQTTDELNYIQHHGGTPATVALHHMIRRLDMEDSHASKGIIMVTDGKPCGVSFPPDFDLHGHLASNQDCDKAYTKGYHDSPKTLNWMSRQSPYPVVGVGIGSRINRVTMIEGFGASNSFNVPDATSVVPIVCDILKSATI